MPNPDLYAQQLCAIFAQLQKRATDEILHLTQVLQTAMDLVCSPGRVALSDSVRVHDRASLLAFLCKHPLGVPAHHSAIQYTALAHDIEVLRRDGNVIVVHGKDEAKLFFSFQMPQRRCDADIILLWQAAR